MEGFCCVDVVPSPKDQEYPAMVPSGSVPEPVKLTVRGAVPDVGLALALAVGLWLGGWTEIWSCAVPVAPLLSVTVRIAV